jgi:hypothetical protein
MNEKDMAMQGLCTSRGIRKTEVKKRHFSSWFKGSTNTSAKVSLDVRSARHAQFLAAESQHSNDSFAPTWPEEHHRPSQNGFETAKICEGCQPLNGGNTMAKHG